jgi:hypothetical protein
MVDILIERLDGSSLPPMKRAERLAEGFFRLDPSSRAGGIDVELGQTPPNEITRRDLETINRTFVARSSPDYWRGVLGTGSLSWLRDLDPSWDLIGLADAEWRRFGCREKLSDAFSQLIPRDHLGQAVVTKMLHLKRPRLVPVCDRFVVELLRAPGSLSTSDLVEHIREQGMANLPALRSIQSYLAARGIDRSLVRILDALLWTSHKDSLTYPLIDLIKDWSEPAGHTSYH